MREYYDRVKVLRDKSKFRLEPDFPIYDLRIELSNVCNHQCIFCANRKMNRKKGFIDEALLKRILLEAYEDGFRGVGYYSTGEPFVSQNLPEYVKWAKEIGYEYVYITTNGAAVGFDRIKEVIDAGLDSIKYSINGTDRDTYQLIHGRDDFDKVISNLKMTYEYKKSINRKLNVFVSFAVTKYTQQYVGEFIEKYKCYADDIITANVINMGGYVPEVNEYLLAENHTDFSEGMTIPCYSLWNAVIVTWEGFLTACCADFQNYFIYADLNKVSLKEAWHCEKIRELRKRHLEGDIENSPCVSCVTKRIEGWKPLQEEYATRFDCEKMFNMEEAEKRIAEYENKRDRVKQMKDLLASDGKILDYAQEKIAEFSKETEIVLFGAGISGRIILDFLKKNGINPVCFCDNNQGKVGEKIEGLEIISSESLKESYRDALIIISCDAYREVTEQLKADGFDTEQRVVFFDPDWIKNPKGNGRFIMDHLSDFEDAFHRLEDSRSREVFISLLNYKLTHNLDYIKKIADSNMYFDKELVRLDEAAVFVDAGAYTGDTVTEFLEFSGGKYGWIICLEPNRENADMLNSMIKEKKIKNVDVYKVGASDRKQKLAFSVDSNIGARISDDGGETIDCDTLDHICLQNKYDHIDFIKMDIEGSEYYALQGAREVIARDHPILAVCVYHKEDDFYRLPLLIKKLYPGYKLYFRQYELSAEETVCYAIP